MHINIRNTLISPPNKKPGKLGTKIQSKIPRESHLGILRLFSISSIAFYSEA